MASEENEVHIGGYSKVFAIGHRAIAGLFDKPVLVEEKVDGSQFSAMRVGDTVYCRSKKQQIVPGEYVGMFERGVDAVQALDLHEGWVYRGEYLAKPKHNTLAYDRIPAHHVIVFDISTKPSYYLTWPEKKAECERVGLECVPCLFSGIVKDVDQLLGMLDTVSILGGQNIEGLVVKNYDLWVEDGKYAIGKFVSEKFKEVHQGSWSARNPGGKDIVGLIGDKLHSEARWNKAVQHLREAGTLLHAPQDIGPLMKEVQRDILEEEAEQIKETLFKWAWKQISKQTTHGLPEWYKTKLAESAFGGEGDG